MDTAYKKTLELDKVLARAVQLCACRETKEMMQDLQPCETPEDERYALEQTVPLAQACKIAQRGGNFQQFPHREDAALLGMGDHAPHLGDRSEA